MARVAIAVLFYAVLASASATRPWLGRWMASINKPAENLNEFMTALGVSADKFPVAEAGEPFLFIIQEGNVFSSSLQVSSKTFHHTHRFTLGDEITQEDPLFDNVPVKFTYTEDGDKLKAAINIPSKNKTIHDTYEVNGDELVKTFEIDGVKGKRFFKKAAAPILLSMTQLIATLQY